MNGIMKQELKSSSKRVGQLYPILVDYYGTIIDGKHRFSADREWKRITLEHVKTEKDRLVARIISNNLRRSVSSDEKKELLGRLGEIHLSEGIELGKIAYGIARRARTSKLLDPPEEALSIRAYANTEFVNIILKKPLYEKLEEKAKKLETTPDKLIYNAILLILKT